MLFRSKTPQVTSWRRRTTPLILLLLLTVAAALAACQPVAVDGAPSAADESSTAPADSGNLVIYSGRNENLVGPLIEQFAADTGIDVEVRYGGTAEMAATILEEGANSPADLFYGQDAGALGALGKSGRLVTLPDSLLEQVDSAFRSANAEWVGASGRARTLVYNTELLQESDLPADIHGLADAAWQGKVGWAPTNGSFQAFVTALRILEGEEAARQWLESMIANEVQSYPNNSSIVEATGRGEIAAGLVNHYYLFRFLAEEGDDFPAANYFFPEGAGAMINVAGLGILSSGQNQAEALQFAEYLLSDASQQYFADQTNEYPLTGADIQINSILTPLAEINHPDLDLSGLDDLQGTLELLQDVGALD